MAYTGDMAKRTKKRAQAIAIWAGALPAHPTIHFWYKSQGGEYRCVCDDAEWPDRMPPSGDDSSPYVPCLECRGMYVDDIVSGELRLMLAE